MFVIITANNKKYWTEHYDEKADNFISFKCTSKTGVSRQVQLNKTAIIEITEVNRELNS